MKTTDVCDHVLLDGGLVARDEARISPLGDGFMFGHGLFETVKVLAGRPVFFEEHTARLERSARELGLSVGGDLRARCQRVIEKNGLRQGALKIVIFQSGAGTGELILARTFVQAEPPPGTGFAVKLFPDGRIAGGGTEWKSLNYLRNHRARAAAKAAGFHEALFVNSAGVVLEGATSNLFLVKEGTVFTPDLSAGILPGIARGIVLRELGKKAVRETTVTEVMLERADEIFVTNSLIGVMPVTRLETRGFEPRVGGLTAKIRAAYQKAEQASVALAH